MTPEQLLKECDRAEAFAKEHDLDYRPVISLIIPRICYGRRARIFPGVTGCVLGSCCDGSGTVVSVETAKIRHYLASATQKQAQQRPN